MTNPWSQIPLRAPSRDEDMRVWANQVCARINALMGIDYDTSEPLASAHVVRHDNPHSVTAYQSGADVAGTAQTLVASESAVRALADAAETSARIAADTAEADARSAGDVTEATARIAADSAESAARALADTNERNERIIADSTHAADLSTHGVTEIVGTAEAQTLTNKTVPDLQFSLTGPARTPSEGMIYWDTVEKTLAAKLEGSSTVLQIGQETHVRCTNKTGLDIPNGSVVYISGAFSQRPTIALAKADADATGRAIGVTTQEIKKNNTGYVTIDGLVHDLNTAAFTAGDVLYLSSSSAGGMQNTAPAFPNYCIEIGVVLYADATAGEVLVHPKLEPTNHVMLNHLGAKDAKIGDIGGGNYTEFESDGTMRAAGNATTHTDLLGDITKLKVVGTGIADNTAESTITMQTSANLLDYVYANYQMSHAWKSGSTLHPHIHFEQANNNMPNFLIEYRYQINGGTKVTSWTRLKCNTRVFTYVSGTLNQIAKTAAGITPGSYNISDILEIRIFRDNANGSGLFTGADPYTGNVEITSVDIHYEQDTMGSRTEYSK